MKPNTLSLYILYNGNAVECLRYCNSLHVPAQWRAPVYSECAWPAALACSVCAHCIVKMCTLCVLMFMLWTCHS